MFFGSKDTAVIAAFNRIIGDMLYDHGGFLLFDQASDLHDELFRVALIHCKRRRLDSLQNRRNGAAGAEGFLCNFSKQIIRNLPMYCVFQRFSASLCSIEAVTTTHHICIQSIPLCSMTDGVLQLADIEFTVNTRDCFGNQFIGVEINGIGVLVVDGIPEFLELCFFKPSVQRIFQNLWLVGIRKHLLENACVINRLHQGVDAFFYWFQRIRNRSKRFCLCILPVLLRYIIFFVHIAVAN